ncbi:MAG: hypothetical protein ABJL43_09340 [Maribacter dokdonensis]|uniref:hypothetical protein n=1 Tax=Maribacter dokdonensis TaxID=320912 RepID=UPI003299AC7C
MRHLEVLVVTKSTTNPRILNWKVSTVRHVEQVIEHLQQHHFAVVALSSTLSEPDKKKLNTLLPLLKEDLVLVEYTEDSNLAETVKAAYWKTKLPNAQTNYLDNSLVLNLAQYY